MRSVALRLGTAALPLLLTPLWLLAITTGVLGFGGGEKDVFLVVPWAAWSLAFMAVALIAWAREVAPGRALWLAAGLATGAIATLWLALLLYSLAV